MSLFSVLFPGQGEQRTGMLHCLPPAGDDVLREASEVLRQDARELDREETLAGTRATQLALLLSGVSWYRELAAAGLAADFLAGHSIGLWAAAVCSGAVDLADAVRLVSLRGEAMQKASPPGAGMLVVQGLGESAVESVTRTIRDEGMVAWSSNVNAPTQIAVSGTTPGLERASQLLRDRGAQRVVKLNVSVPAHSALMHDATERVRAALDAVEVRRPRAPLLGNVTGQTLFTADALREDLWRSIERPVRWDIGTSILSERGVTEWMQLPPGRALSTLAAALPGSTALALDDVGPSEAIARVIRQRRA